MKGMLLLLVLVPALASAKMYRWTDADGHVHFSDKQPQNPQEKVESLDVQGPKKIGQDREVRAINERADRLMKAEERKQQEKARREQQRQARKRSWLVKECARQRKNLVALSGPVVYVDKNSGTRHDVSLKQVESDRKRVADWVQKNCQGI